MRRSLTPKQPHPQPLYSLTPNPSPKERGVITAKG